jgi:tetratricopeptide (TPR) repeat protein
MDKITLLESAVQASKRGNLAESIALLEQYAKHEDTDPRIMAWLGSLYEEKGEHLAAIAAFERALALDDSSATAQSGLAQALYSVGRLSDAILAMRKALDRAATAPRYILLGVMQRELGHDAEAEQSFRAALVLETGNDEALLNLALLIRPERPDEALALLRRAVQVDPANAAATRELGFSLLRQERGSIESERALRTAMMLDPEDAWTHVYCGHVAFAQRRLSDAEEYFTKASALAPAWSVPRWLLGSVHEAMGQLADAKAFFESALAIEPADPIAAYHLARCFWKLGMMEEAREWIAYALEYAPTDPRALDLQRALAY